MKILSLLLIGVMLGILFSVAGITPVVAASVDKESKASFTYVIGTHSSWYWITNLTEVNDKGKDGVFNKTGSVAIYDNGSHIFVYVGVWSKPYLAYGELDKDGDGFIDPNARDNIGDRVIDRYDLKSDGIIIEGLGNPHGATYPGYRWFVDTKVGSTEPAKFRDPEITVPSWNLNLNKPGGILDGPIEYFATIPIPPGQTTLHLEVHASPPAEPPFPEFVIPELPIGTLGAVSVLFLALGAFIFARKMNGALRIRLRFLNFT